MTKRTTNQLGIIITILAGMYFYITCCNECGSQSKEDSKKEVVTPVAPETTSYSFAFYNGNYSHGTKDNFNFNVSSSSLLIPISKRG